jgi:hypothetical protein
MDRASDAPSAAINDVEWTTVSFIFLSAYDIMKDTGYRRKCKKENSQLDTEYLLKGWMSVKIS